MDGVGGRVRVRVFAALRERAGRGEWEEALAPGETIGALYRRLFPPAELPVAYVLNRETVRADAPLAAGDEVAFLPPVGGG